MVGPDGSEGDSGEHDEHDDDAVALDLASDGADLVATAQRRYGVVGGVIAAGMLGIDEVLGRKHKQDAPIVVSAPTEPVDIDRDGFDFAVDDATSIVTPALPRTPPKVSSHRRSRR